MTRLRPLQDALHVDLLQKGVHRQLGAALVLVQRGQQARALWARCRQNGAGDGGSQGVLQVVIIDLQ